jgi:hypothetical protein
MKKLKPESLRPGDMWRRGRNCHPWTFISGRRLQDKIFEEVFFWELIWFGRREDTQPEVITCSWTSDSVFEIVSRAGDTQ